MRASGDFETYSAAGYRVHPHTGKVQGVARDGKGGLPVVGTPVYAEHPSTEVLCLWYDLHDGRGRQFWLPGGPNPQDLFDHIAAGGLFEAFNVTFEWYIWNMVCRRRYDWPVLPIEQCRCVMARCRRHSLPGSLDNAAKVLGVTGKDPDGKRLLQKLTRPHTPTKKRPAIRWTPVTAPDDFMALYQYGEQDVAAEDAVAARIPDLTADEHAVWQLDQRINARGIQVDTVTLDAALSILDQAERKYTQQLADVTGGAVGSVSEIAKMTDWLSTQGVHTPNLQADTVRELLAGELPPAARQVLEIRDALGSANVKKLRTLKLQLSSDGRLRDQYMYCGADRTGRWSAGGVQLQNITAAGPDTRECEACEQIFGPVGDCPRCGSWLWHDRAEWNIEAVEQAIEDIRTGDLEHVERVWGAPIATLCGILRGLFIARPGYKLVAVDYSAIEAVVAACLSRCQWRIDVFSTHGKIYEVSAATLTGRSLDEYQAHKQQHGAHHPDRKLGKVAELSSGFGGWIGAWKAFGAGDFLDDEQIKQAILAWRAASPEIVDMWGGQFRWCGPGRWDFRPELYGLEGAAIMAIENPGTCYAVHDITYGVANDILYCRLPSGRFLHYHRPRLVPGDDKLNRGPCWKITFEGWNSNSQKGPVGWRTQETYSGRLFENVVQGTAGDVLAEGLLRAEYAGYPIVMHTHDEGVAEVPVGTGSPDELAAIMAQRPAWADWWPIRAAGWEHTRYQKD